MVDCGAPVRLTSRIFCAAGRGGGAVNALTPLGAAGAVQLPKRWSSSAFTSLSGRLETTKILTLSGRIQRCWKAARSARWKRPIALSSPPAGPP